MKRLLRHAGLAVALVAPLSFAQTSYEQIQVGTVIRGGIGLGAFQKPLPLPNGDWVVVGNESKSQPITRELEQLSTPKVQLTLKSSAARNPISSLVVSFVPVPGRISWQNPKCENANRNVLVDDFGTTPSSLMSCALTQAQ